LKRNIIEVDIDGVIADIHGALGENLTDIMEGFVGDHHVHSWDMKELNEIDERLRPRILQLFGQPDFIRNLKPFDGAFNSLLTLVAYAEANDLDVVINTNVFNGCVDARKEWLDQFFKEFGITISYNVVSTSGKKMMDSLIIVEDSIVNILNSSAPYKFLVRRGHNRSFTEADFDANSKYHIVDTFSSAVKLIVTGVAQSVYASEVAEG
jgi:5'(3')-deoxyribonucleotidase